MQFKDLEHVSIIGLGLLGGSLGLALPGAFSSVKICGFTQRKSTAAKALDMGIVHEIQSNLGKAVANAQLVILASPLSTFEELFKSMAEHLPEGCIVSDVGSTKALPNKYAQKHLPKHVEYIGSHPMAGSEQSGIDFSRADLFEGANCIVTPTKKNTKKTIDFISKFWENLSMRVSQMTPENHDKALARISHLPHVMAMALVNSNVLEEMMLCGKGFLDTSRVASGNPELWRDILMNNAANTDKAIDKMINELTRFQTALKNNNDKKVLELLEKAQKQRDQLVQSKLKRKELPS